MNIAEKSFPSGEGKDSFTLIFLLRRNRSKPFERQEKGENEAGERELIHHPFSLRSRVKKTGKEDESKEDEG